MSVIGIDFGNESCFIAVARAGGIETIANDYSMRATPSCVAFGEKNRIIGVAAKNQMLHNMKNTCFGFKRLLGRKFRDPRVQQEVQYLHNTITETKDGSVGIKVQYCGEDKIFSPEQITGMLFTKLKEVAESALKIKVNDCVISAPLYFTDAERRAVLDAAQVAGLNVLRLMNEPTAVALAYGIYKQDLPQPEEKPRNVVFLDLGNSALQIAACAFHKGKLKMLANATDPCIGGRDLDRLLADHFAEDFNKRFRVNAKTNPRAYQRLLTEVEKIKKQMSANSTNLPLSIECFIDDKDVNGSIKRTMLEDMAVHLIHRIGITMKNCLQASGLKLDDIYSVEVVGGGCRVPAVRQLIQEVFGKSASTTMNQDEAVARGCALQCAMLSPTFRVREFSVTDIQPYPINLLWNADMGEDGEMEVFHRFHAVPFSKMLTFYRKEPFSLEARYTGDVPYPDPVIGHFTVNKISPTSDGESQKIKIKVRVNIHGIFTLAEATLVEKWEEDVSMDTDKSETNHKTEAESGEKNSETNHIEESQDNDSNPTDSKPEPAPQTVANEKKEEKKVKKKVKSVDLPIESVVRALSKTDLEACIEKEGQMAAQDRLEKERQDAKNAVEEYVYWLRNKLYEELGEFVNEAGRTSIGQLLDDTENWLYDEGEHCQKNIYINKLQELKKLGDPIVERSLEYSERPAVVEALSSTIQLTKKAVDQYQAGDEKYCHLDAAEVTRVEKLLKEKEEWLYRQIGALNNTPKNVTAPVTMAQIEQERQSFVNTVTPILNKPKPKPKVEEPPPSPADKQKTESPTANAEVDNTSATNGTDIKQSNDANMDVD